MPWELIDLFPIWLSVKVAFLSAGVVALLALPLARIMEKYKFRGQDILEAMVMLPLVLPPSVVGYALLMLIGRNGLLGDFLHRIGLSLVFTWWAVVIAASVVAFPLMYQSARGAFASVNPDYEKAARTLGAGELTVFFRVTLPLAWPGLLSGLVLSFARAMGEFGATLMVAGNIPGRTQTIPLAIYFAVESGDKLTANTLVAIISIFCFLLILWVNRWKNKYKQY
ncbi:MAG: molybdate ABC transporter permease subunit [Syntrophomonadaceae bacterium]|nr:molybdate ABC transporter permease subunit [Syntrophomonadaceae bacterium]